jgi:type II secretory pathway pseudopilin PulG
MCPRRVVRGGFTVIELVTVVGIISILIALLLPAIQSAREASRRASCQSNLHQIGLAVQSYHLANGCYPLGVTTWVGRSDAQGSRSVAYYGFFSIHVRLLPLIEHVALYNSINFEVGASPLVTIAYPPANATEVAAAETNATALSTAISEEGCSLTEEPTTGATRASADTRRGRSCIPTAAMGFFRKPL